jgi:phosphate:Na+ symporter
MLPLIGPFSKFIVSISPNPTAGLTGIDAISSVLPRQVANAHTLFNVGIAVLFLPFVSQFARLIYRLVPDRPIEEEVEIQPKFLSDMLFHTPSLALDAARHEIKRMGKRVDLMGSAMMPAVLSGDKDSLLAVKDMYREVDILHKHIVTYLAKVSQLQLNEHQTLKLTNIMAAVNDLDHIGDLIEVNMVELGLRRIEKGFKISEPTKKVINTLHVVVSDALKAAIRAVVEEDIDFAYRVILMKDDMNKLTKQAELHQAERLVAADSGKFEAYSIEVDIIEKLKRIYYHSKRIAKSVIELEEVEKTEAA